MMNQILIKGIKSYPLTAPFHPSELYPEFAQKFPGKLDENTNKVYDAIRISIFRMKLDSDNFNKSCWNPFKSLVPEGGIVTIKPNMVRHWNENKNDSIKSVITHWSLIRPLIDYSLLAVGKNGKVFVGDAPHWDCDFKKLSVLLEIDKFEEFYEKYFPGQVSFVDFRPEWFESSGVVKTTRSIKLNGDPNGYVLVDLKDNSMFADESLNPQLFYGSGYNNEQTIKAHSEGNHKYLIAGSALKCDLFINVPKMKTHHLLGITVAMKNLVGINGDKNFLPHFRKGFVKNGGDQYPRKSPSLYMRYLILTFVIPLISQNYFLTKLWGKFLNVMHSAGGKNPYAGGAWKGNDTVWRMTLDLNRIILYADRYGNISKIRSRNYLTFVDGVIAGEGEGPMNVKGKELGLVVASDNPLLCDLIASKLMGFDPGELKLIEEGTTPHDLQICSKKYLSELKVLQFNYDQSSDGWQSIDLNEIENYNFIRPKGWIKHIFSEQNER